MNFSAPFIRRPIATALLMAALFVCGVIGYNLLPVAALPTVDFPTVQVTASLPGASPQIMASSVAQPLERQFAVLPGLNQLTSTSVQGTTVIALQFDLSRNIDGAAADVQAAINAAGGTLPKNLPNPPTYKKVNPADQPVLILGLTSDVMTLHELDQFADLNIAQRISMLPDVGQVLIFGEQKYAPTVQVNPGALAARGLGLDDVATAISNATVQLPIGTLQGPQQAYQIGANSQLLQVGQLAQVIVAYKNGSPVRVGQIGRVVDGSDSPLQLDWVNNHIGEMIGIWRQPGSNTLELVDRVKSMLPQLRAGIPPSVKLTMVSDRSTSISASFSDVKLTLMLTIVLVVIVIFIFLRSLWATIIPSITVPLALVGSFAVLYLCGYSLDNLSLMALTLAVGLVVDDAVVMLENIFRYLERGDDAQTAALKGSGEIGFTIVSITVSLIAVFIPLLFMGGIIGRLFREFAIAVTAAIVLSAHDRLDPVADDGGAVSEGPAHGQARPPLSVERARFRRPVRRLCPPATAGFEAEIMGDAAQRGADRRHRRDDRDDPQGLFPRRRHRDDLRLYRSFARRVVHGDGRSSAARRGSADEGPGDRDGRLRDRRRRQLGAQHRPHVRQPQARRRARPDRRGHPAPAAGAGRGARHHHLSAAGRQHPARRPAQPHPVPVHPAGHRNAGALSMGAQARAEAQGDARVCRTSRAIWNRPARR